MITRADEEPRATWVLNDGEGVKINVMNFNYTPWIKLEDVLKFTPEMIAQLPEFLAKMKADIQAALDRQMSEQKR